MLLKTSQTAPPQQPTPWCDTLDLLCECVGQAVPCCASEHWRLETVLDRSFHREREPDRERRR